MRPRRDAEVAVEPVEPGAQEAPPEPQGEYELHIQKPTLEELMNLFIVWGLAILKKKWLDRMGYR